MKQFWSFIRKEFLHVFRDRKTLIILFGMPVVQILIFGFALTNEIKNSRIMVLDAAHDIQSSRLISKIQASRYFQVTQIVHNEAEIQEGFRGGNVNIAIVFPLNFGHDLESGERPQLQVLADASDPNLATALTNYVSNITADYQREIQKINTPIPTIVPEIKMMYNPQLKGAPNFVPGVMALVLLLVCVMMTAVSIVREKETGTMEILLVSPFKPILVILSKTIPYLFVSLINVGSILLLSVLVLDLPIHGSLLLLLLESTLFIITCLILGIFISVKTQTMQAAMLISLMGMLLPTMLFSGFMFPIENMPKPLQIISNIIPSKWFYIIVKSIMIKGLGWEAIWKETLYLLGIAVFFFALGMKNFKIRLA
ncbi:MAG: ABC transporter permease [Bacteroidetes bacterium]|nr:ABC transporter permease [Bacteroidota bacterium]